MADGENSSGGEALRRTARERDTSGWLPAVGIALAAGLLMTLAAGAVRVPGAGSAEERVSSVARPPDLVVTRVDWLPAGDLVRERLRLFDPTPLFMPGGTGAALPQAGADGLADRPSGEAGAEFPPSLAFPEQRPTREIFRPELPADALAASRVASAERWFYGMARADRPTAGAEAGPPAETGSGRVDVYRVGEAARVASVVLPADPVLGAQTWRPLEMSVLLDAAGVVGKPAVTLGSGVGEVDEHVRRLVAGEVMPRLLLRPGAYRLVAGP